MDAIVVGAGPAGCAAALTMARAGMEVVLIERGAAAGSKNVTGGRLYTHALDKLFPDGWDESALERRVTREKVSFITDESTFTMDFHSNQFGKNSYTVVRARMDAWLAEQAEAAGVMVATGVRVDDLIMENGKVVGVKAGEDEMYANVVIIAEGANSLLPRKAGLRTKEIDPHHIATGVKTSIELPAKVIEDRFNVAPGEGAAQLFAGTISHGGVGGGFLYTNRETISLGMVITIQGMREKRISPNELMEEFKEHPSIAPLIDGGKVVEYSAHMVPEGGLEMMPQIIGDGVLVAGDAAGFVLNVGYTVRGMDFAMASGMAAGEAAIAAKEKGDFTKAGLASYEDRLRNSFVFRDLEHYKNFPHFMESTPRMFNTYPELIRDVMLKMFTIDGSAPVHMLPMLMGAMKGKVSLMDLAKDGWKGMRAL